MRTFTHSRIYFLIGLVCAEQILCFLGRAISVKYLLAFLFLGADAHCVPIIDFTMNERTLYLYLYATCGVNIKHIRLTLNVLISLVFIYFRFCDAFPSLFGLKRRLRMTHYASRIAKPFLAI